MVIEGFNSSNPLKGQYPVAGGPERTNLNMMKDGLIGLCWETLFIELVSWTDAGSAIAQPIYTSRSAISDGRHPNSTSLVTR